MDFKKIFNFLWLSEAKLNSIFCVLILFRQAFQYIYTSLLFLGNYNLKFIHLCYFYTSQISFQDDFFNVFVQLCSQT